jgi:two-component system, LytTR family, response regulator
MNIRFSCIIADDERPAREELSALIARDEFIDILCLCSNAAAAKEKIEALKPDAVFLDINMPGQSGFDLLESLDEIPMVVFCTAYDEYALKAFEENALDYLLKPITPERLSKAIQRIRQQLVQSPEKDKLHRKMFIRDGKRIFCTSPHQIHLIEAKGNYVKYYFGNDTASIRKTLKESEDEFGELGFIAINRTQLVNTSFISTPNVIDGRNITIQLKNGMTLKASRSKSSNLKDGFV